MPDAAPPSPLTTTYMTQNVRQQVVAQLAAASLPAAATEGRVFADTTNDRLVFDTGSVLLPGPPWAAGGRVGWVLSDATNRSIPSGTGTYTATTYATEGLDSDGYFSAPGTTVTIPSNRGGLYFGYFACVWASSPGANSVIDFTVNSATALRFPITNATQALVCSATFVYPLAAGNTVQVRLSQGSGGAINVNPSYWSMWRVSA